MAMSRALKQVVDEVWRIRADLMLLALGTGRRKGETHIEPGNRAIIRIYNKISGAVTGREPGDRDMLEFERTLRRKLIGNYGTPSFLLQSGDGVDLGKLNRFPAPKDWQGLFIHVIKKKRPKVVRERIYLNLKESHRANAFGAIVKKIWHLSGVDSAKVAAPGAEKVDTVVIYCEDAATRDDVVKIVTKYQKRNQRFFASQLPSLVAQAGFGIGYGAEPPSITPIRRNSRTFEGVNSGQSFSYYRATLIFIALERTQFPEEMEAPDSRRAGIDLRGYNQANPRDGMRLDIGGMQRRQLNAVQNMGQKMEFERRVEELFRLAGLDPEHPELQNDAHFTA